MVQMLRPCTPHLPHLPPPLTLWALCHTKHTCSLFPVYPSNFPWSCFCSLYLLSLNILSPSCSLLAFMCIFVSQYLHDACNMPGAVLLSFSLLIHLTLKPAVRGNYYHYPDFKGGRTELQSSLLWCLFKYYPNFEPQIKCHCPQNIPYYSEME